MEPADHQFTLHMVQRAAELYTQPSLSHFLRMLVWDVYQPYQLQMLPLVKQSADRIQFDVSSVAHVNHVFVHVTPALDSVKLVVPVSAGDQQSVLLINYADMTVSSSSSSSSSNSSASFVPPAFSRESSLLEYLDTVSQVMLRGPSLRREVLEALVSFLGHPMEVCDTDYSYAAFLIVDKPPHRPMLYVLHVSFTASAFPAEPPAVYLHSMTHLEPNSTKTMMVPVRCRVRIDGPSMDALTPIDIAKLVIAKAKGALPNFVDACATFSSNSLSANTGNHNNQGATFMMTSPTP
jgi:hypothetical protein